MRLDFVVGIAEHLLPSSGVHNRVGFQVPVPDALLRAGDRKRQPLFAFTQGPLCVFLFGDVSHDDLDRPFALLVQLRTGHADVANRSIRPDDFRVPGP